MPIDATAFQVRAVMTSVTGLPEDQFVNTWNFKWDGAGLPAEADFANLAGHVGDFYRLGAVPNDQVGSYIGEAVDRAATHLIEIASIFTGGSPVYSTPWLGPTTNTGTANLPLEVAGVLSYHGSLTGALEEVGITRPRARRRGRVYIGPLQNNAIVGGVDVPSLATSFRLAMSSNAITMADAAFANDWTWCVWSRADDEMYTVVGGWTDNAPDTQRRRGQASTSRTTWGPVGP